jgi:zinc transport system substrate-binding protein
MRTACRTALLATSLLAGTALASPAQAAPAEVVATVKPVHSLVSAVMDGVGEPKLLLEAGQSPHTYSLTPSDAGALENADLVVWVGPALEAFLERPVRNIAQDDAAFQLMRLEGLSVLRTREGGTWAGHSHAHGDHDHGGGGHGDSHEAADKGEHDHDHGHDHADAHADEGEHEHGHGDDHAHGDDHDHDHDHGDAHAHGDGHDHEHGDAHDHGHDHGDAHSIQGIPEDEVDPHIWLDPENARVIVQALAERLAALDPENAETYRQNAEAARQRIAEVDAEVADRIAPVADEPYVVFHDAYHYFEAHYGTNAVGSITLSPDRKPGAQRLAEIRGKITELDARCVFREPQFAPDLVETVVENTEAEIGTLDPLGVDHAAGPDAYPRMLRDLAVDLTDCLSPKS